MGVNFDDSGFRKFREKLNKISGKQDIPLPELFPDDFIRQNSRFQTLQALLDAAGVKSQEDIDSEAFGEFITANTRFATWDDMGQIAVAGWSKRKLGL